MVEGPGCTLNGEKLKSKVKGQRVTGVRGSAISKYDKASSPFHQLIGFTISEILTLGKELFIFFHGCTVALRAHFLMSGSIRINGKHINAGHGTTTESPTFELILNKDIVTFCKTAVAIRDAAECTDKHSRLKYLDVCKDLFSHAKAVEEILKHPNRLVVDVLLDQEVLPGVGNIIKNEGLFDSGIRPSSRIHELTSEQISILVRMTRDFTILFYKCRRDGKQLYKYMHIYRKGKCGLCGNKTVTTKMGEDSPRLTTYCPHCQDNNTKKSINLMQPSKNTLLGWVSSVKPSDTNEEQTDWSCYQCTYINTPARKSCAMCLTLKDKTPNVKENENLNNNAHKNDISLKKTSCKRISTEPEHNMPKKRRSLAPPLIPFKPCPSLSLDNEKLPVKQQSAPISVEKCTGAPKAFTQVTSDYFENPPLCKEHNQMCIIRQVHKTGENKGRMFYTCSHRKEKQCKFFKWADEKFPKCNEHDKVTVLRTVYKEGLNNGRKFFACSRDKKKQCSFFQWADTIPKMYGDL